jgi:hypothetical protein
MESLCRSLSELADSLRAKSEGAEGGPEVPGSLDAALGAARTALQSEVAALRAPAKKKTGKQGGRADKETLNEANVLRSSWRALNALQDQLRLVQKKQGEYESALSAASN